MLNRMHAPARRIPLAMFAGLVLLPLALAGCPKPPPETVPAVDLERYAGLWHQVAGYPFPPSAGLVGITAEYTPLDDGTVRVVNRGYAGDFDGPEDVIEGVARVTDPMSNAKLAVSFPSVAGGLFEGKYWIIKLDEDDYQYAVVSDPLRLTLFVLHREPNPGEAFISGIIDDLADRGFKRALIERTPQPPPA